MKDLWSEQRKYQGWLDVELALLRARVKLGQLEPGVYESIAQHASFSVERVEAIDTEINHDLISLVQTVQESLTAAGYGEYSREVHKGITSFDTEDPALMLRLGESARIILAALDRLYVELLNLAHKHKTTMMIARTHGQYAEPDSFGRLCLVFADQQHNNLMRLRSCIDEELIWAKFSGAIGNYAGLDPELERLVLEELGLMPVDVSTQIVQRDHHASYLNVLAVIASTIEQLARTLWEMSRSDVGEVREPFGKKQKGSSAMAHKKNPIMLERMIGMAKMVRAKSQTLMEVISTPECRDISQSCVEREVYPDATSYTHYMIVKMTNIVRGLEVSQGKMKENLERTLGVWASQQIRIALIDAGVSYEEAYRFMQERCFAATQDGKHLNQCLDASSIQLNGQHIDIINLLGGWAVRVERFFDAWEYTKDGIEAIFERFPTSTPSGG